MYSQGQDSLELQIQTETRRRAPNHLGVCEGLWAFQNEVASTLRFGVDVEPDRGSKV